MPEYEGKVAAPDFPEGMQWLNTERPLSLRELRGKVVVLDFWTYCCINCMHLIPDLKRLEQKYAAELVVIGVHSAKFTGERDTENIRQAILRYEIEHPVLNDRDMRVWEMYGARAWPTVMLIDPAGKLIGYVSGEGVYEAFDELIGKVIQRFDAKGQIDRRPLGLALERHRAPTALLAFPGKVLADETARRLFVADSNHNRIVVLSLPDAAVTEVIGNAEIGMDDGDFEHATFNHPQGMALDGKALYVADTENHAIRRVDLDGRAVTTAAGTGQQARRFSVAGPARMTALNSPWDLVIHKGALYIAMAGSHQIWRMDLTAGQVAPYAGSGREARIDGPLAAAALAQPSGITTDGTKLYFADSEVSAIRAADLDPRGRVETIVGEDLFEFGDIDGSGSAVRLQHPLGVVHHGGLLYVADTYNNKIKRVSPKQRTSETFLGSAEAGMRDGEAATFDEPGGVSVAGGKLYIADTNNHVIRVADLATRRVDTLQMIGLDRLRPRAGSPRLRGKVVDLAAQTVEPGEALLSLSLELPAGYKLNPQAPTRVTVSVGDAAEQTFENPQFPLRVPVQVGEEPGSVTADFVVYYCEAAKERLCYFKQALLVLPVRVEKGVQKKALDITCKLTIP